jgi:hypothetical protein
MADETTELNELSKKTLGSYIKKAVTNRDRAKNRGDKEEDESMATDGNKYPEKQARHMNNASKEFNTVSKRQSGLQNAANKTKKTIPDAYVGNITPKKTKIMATKEETEEEMADTIEETTAAETLKPKSAYSETPASKIEVMKSVIGSMASMEKDDLLKWYTDTIAQVGSDHFSKATSGKEDANKNTINTHPSDAQSVSRKPKMEMPKLSVKEDMAEMFAGQELSEEFKDKATIIFEAALNSAIMTETVRLEEAYEEAYNEALNEEIDNLEKQLIEQIDTYLDFVVENWITENKVAIESTLRNEIMEEFVDGLKNLFTEHYIEIPETKIDVLESLAAKVEDLEEALNKSLEINADLKEDLLEANRKDIVAEMSEGLALTQKEKFMSLIEGIEFTGDIKVYERKLNVIKENYFKNNTPSTSNITEETFEDTNVSKLPTNLEPEMKSVMDAISRTSKPY